MDSIPLFHSQQTVRLKTVGQVVGIVDVQIISPQHASVLAVSEKIINTISDLFFFYSFIFNFRIMLIH